MCEKYSEFLQQAIEQDFGPDDVATFLERDISLFEDCVSVTFAPNNDTQNFDMSFRMDKVQSYMFQLLKKIVPDHIKFDIFTEISTPTTFLAANRGGRVHFHGIFYFTQKYSRAEFYLHVIPNISCVMQMDVDTIFSISGWFFYITKDTVSRNYCESMGYPYHFSERSQLKNKQNISYEADSKLMKHQLTKMYDFLDYGTTNKNKRSK